MTDIEYLKKYYNGNILDAIKRLELGEPVQYIVGNVDFYGLLFDVDKRVLIPRFETEGLVEIGLKNIKDNMSVVDLGCGSGCIGITLKKKNSSLDVTCVDISSSALEVARSNALKNNVEINFLNGDMLNPLDKKVDVIISNPPYLSFDSEVMDIVKNNEPSNALYAEDDGYYFYIDILKNAHKYLNNKYLVLFEIGYNQADRITRIAKEYLDCLVEVKKDLQGFDRYVIIRSKNYED